MPTDYSFLALDLNLIPQSTKDNTPNFWKQRFNASQTRLLVCGYDAERNLVHTGDTFNRWLEGVSEDERAQLISDILNTAQEFTYQEITDLTNDINSEWYLNPQEFD